MVIHHKQVSLLDCGLACSKTLLSVYGIDDIDIEKFFNKNSDQGMSLLDIELLLKRFSIKSTSYEVDNFSLIQKIDSPFIALVNRSGLPHYIVVIKNNNGVLTISDPSQSEITKITMLDFKSIFAGVVLIPKNNSSVNKEKRHEDFTKESTISHELYQKFIDSLYLKQKFSLFFFGILKVVLPIVMSLVLQYVTVNVISLAVSNQIFIITSVLLSLLIFKIISYLEVVLKTDIENQFLYETLEKYYYSRLEDYSEEKNYDFTVGYFWNLLTSVSGIFQKFYLKIYIVMFVIIMVFLASFNLLFFIVTLLSLILLWVYNYFKVLQLEKNQRDFVSTSSNFTYLVESSIDGLYDISSFDKSLEFKNEFKQRMKELLDVKLESALITNLVNTSVQVFIVGLASTFIVITNFYYINSSFIDYSNSVLLIIQILYY